MTDDRPKKKILFVITKSNFGGAQKYVLELATTLPRDRFEVVVVLGGTGVLIDKLRSASVRTITLSTLERDVNPLKDIASFGELWHIFQNEKPDIIHLNSAKASGLGALAGRLARVPKIIFTAHGWAFNEERSLFSRLLIKIFSWVTIALAHKTIAVSASVQKDVTHWPFVTKKITLVKNGITEPSFLPRGEARVHLFAYTNITTPPHAFVVGTIAELHQNKGLGYAIEAIAKLVSENPNLYYFVLGSGEEKEHLEALVELHRLQGRVFLLGFVQDAALFLKGFDAFLLPSTKEGLPLVILEAGFAGLPVIATTVGGTPEVIKHERTGLLVPPRDPKAIAKSIATLADSPNLCKTMGAKLREEVLASFSFERALRETMNLYEAKD